MKFESFPFSSRVRLICISGAEEKRVYPLWPFSSNSHHSPTLADEVVIGREQGCEIRINDASLSRRHCAIRRVSDKYQVADLDSANGTFVDGQKIDKVVLSHGQIIRVGTTSLIFLLEKEERTIEPYAPSIAETDEESNEDLRTISLEPAESLYLSLKKVEAAIPDTFRLARDLGVLVRIGIEINSFRTLDELKSQLLRLLLEATPAEYAAIILGKDWSDPNLSITSLNSHFGTPDIPPPSKTVVQRAWRDGLSIRTNSVHESPEFAPITSLIVARINSLIAVPLKSGKRVTGIIYLATEKAASHFDRLHLELVTAIGGIAALAIDKVRRIELLEEETRRLREESSSNSRFIGRSRSILRVREMIARVAPADSTVLLRGENGTGKEVVARAIHELSPRRDMPFVAINCAALTESLLESELFGHEKGAFTGATSQKKGKLEIADGGTLFLDEIGEMPLSTQAKLLRALQERTFERVGGLKPVSVDIRVLAATNRNLEEAIAGNTFRQDLFYRISVITINIPPLRERKEDIRPLAAWFATKHAESCKRIISGIAEEAMQALINHDWPGNVRELQNAIEHAVVLGSTDTILPEDLPESVLDSQRSSPSRLEPNSFSSSVREAKIARIRAAIEQANGNISQAAKLLGMQPPNLHRLMRQLGLRDKQ